MEAGSDTTSLFLQSLIFCLVASPEVQARAHKDIDEAIGSDRSPRFEDFDNLPYIDAIIKEVGVPDSNLRQLTNCVEWALWALGTPIPACRAHRNTSWISGRRSCMSLGRTLLALDANRSPHYRLTGTLFQRAA